MHSFFLDLNKGPYPGIAIFLTLIVVLVEVYKKSHGSDDIKKHKQALESSISFLSTIKISKLPIYSANITLSFFNLIFLKPRKYTLFEKTLWNYRIVLFFCIIVALFNSIFTLAWSSSINTAFMLNFPSLIVALDVVKLTFLKKYIMTTSYIKKDFKKYNDMKERNDFEMITISSYVHIVGLVIFGVFLHFISGDTGK
ncbi:MAG: Unknown protein [uncultured Sulfurovum sp.]|uniref:Uncharacterized protein n=1 Tax=uncultured Sulfurovum sp. TaxID=269237 RepID=A0A6S6U8U5_9BACT|nr:MAG: Unknown protein [uncultured Sulfurovum sp.]